MAKHNCLSVFGHLVGLTFDRFPNTPVHYIHHPQILQVRLADRLAILVFF